MTGNEIATIPPGPVPSSGTGTCSMSRTQQGEHPGRKALNLGVWAGARRVSKSSPSGAQYLPQPPDLIQ